jgi:hypothetical protein
MIPLSNRLGPLSSFPVEKQEYEVINMTHRGSKWFISAAGPVDTSVIFRDIFPRCVQVDILSTAKREGDIYRDGLAIGKIPSETLLAWQIQCHLCEILDCFCTVGQPETRETASAAFRRH